MSHSKIIAGRSAAELVAARALWDAFCIEDVEPTSGTKREGISMHIRIGYELIYDCPQPTPMLLMLNIHSSRTADLVVPDRMVAAPTAAIHQYNDAFGNQCSRILAPSGQIRLSADAVVSDTGEPDAVAAGAQQYSVDCRPAARSGPKGC